MNIKYAGFPPYSRGIDYALFFANSFKIINQNDLTDEDYTVQLSVDVNECIKNIQFTREKAYKVLSEKYDDIEKMKPKLYCFLSDENDISSTEVLIAIAYNCQGIVIKSDKKELKMSVEKLILELLNNVDTCISPFYK